MIGYSLAAFAFAVTTTHVASVRRADCLAAGSGPDSVPVHLIAAVNDGSYAAIDGVVGRYWNAQRFPAEAIAEFKRSLGRWHWASTRLSDVRACATAPNRAHATATNALTGEIDSVAVMINPQTGKIMQMSIVQGAVVPVTHADTASDKARADAVARLVRSLGKAGVFSGEVILARDGKILYHDAVGIANRETGEKTRIGQQYSMASVGKIITASAIMRLVEDGRLSLDDTLGKFLPAGERPAGAAGVALKYILAHTDGMVRDSDSLAFRPGTRFEYVNYGYYLLGLVIERVTGKPFAEYFQEAIFPRADMKHTRRLDVKAVDPSLPPGYSFAFDSSGVHFTVNPQLQLTAATGAGGLFTTAEDLFHFAKGLRAGRIVSLAALDSMRGPRHELGASEYGLGVDWYRGNNIWGHSGGIPGTAADIEFYGDSGYLLVVIGNTETNYMIRRRVLSLIGTRPVCRSLAAASCTPR